jgi:hypothetical protein
MSNQLNSGFDWVVQAINSIPTTQPVSQPTSILGPKQISSLANGQIKTDAQISSLAHLQLMEVQRIYTQEYL